MQQQKNKQKRVRTGRLLGDGLGRLGRRVGRRVGRLGRRVGRLGRRRRVGRRRVGLVAARLCK
jgi:hypothetical protein